MVCKEEVVVQHPNYSNRHQTVLCLYQLSHCFDATTVLQERPFWAQGGSEGAPSESNATKDSGILLLTLRR